MSKRLVKVAKELNVGTSTIVEYLINNGFDIDNKPTAKVTDEMYSKLLEAFSNSKEEKSKADQLIIGSRVSEEVEPPKPVVVPPPPPPVVPTPVAVVEKKVEKKEPKPEEEPKEVKIKAPKISVKVVDKIDLEKAKKPKAEPKPKPKAEAKPKPKKPTAQKDEAKIEAKPTESKVEPKGEAKSKEAEKAPVDEIVRAATPQLQGLKIMGKIDTKKLTNRPKKSDKAKEEAKKKEEQASEDRKKRKRKRKKIITNTGASNKGGANKPGANKANRKTDKRVVRNNEVKEVSKKEIEEKIKATMARIKGGKSNKRQKIRRDSRVEKREKQEILENEGQTEIIQLTEFISVSDFASLLDKQATDIIMSCMNMGVIVSINQRLDAEIIELIADEYGREIEFISAEEIDEDQEEIIDDPKDLKPRAPIVTVMGHVDHGKTSLLDHIRSANVASGEAGGITQHIGAYEVKVNGKKVTFLDTPGHEAFTAMRARGAKVTDVVIIIIAADDRIMPQTKEAISHAQAAGVPMIFAINKIDKDGAQPERIKQELASMNLLIEEWGGQFQSQDISAKTGLGINELLEKILLEAEVLDLKANPNRNSIGTVIEASLDKGRGYVTKMLVQTGTMSIGDVVVAGGASGKVKAMFNERGERLKKAGPSTPILLLGLNGAPQAGEKFKIVDTEQEARQIASKRLQIDREQSNRANKRISLDEFGRRLALASFKELNLIVKGDVDGSIEALSDSLIKLSIESVQINVIHKAVGQIAESDVLLASASDAIIVGFQVRPSSGARNLAEKEGVEIKTYSIIYEAIDEIKSAIEGMLEPTKEEKLMGEVEVRETFKISKVGTIAGSYVNSGMITRNSLIRVIRDGIVMYPNKQGQVGEISALKRFKDDVKEVKKGLECGVLVKNYNDLKVGDIIEAYEIVEIKQTLD